MNLDKRRVRAAFSRAAPTYDAVAVLQRELATRMVERLELFRIAPNRILDLGAGTGFATAALRQHYPDATLLAVDFAQPMLQHLRRQWSADGPAALPICADMDQLPLADGSIDLIFSNATLQWSNDLSATLRELRRVIAPGGLLLFTSFGPDTLHELRNAWATVDHYRHTNPFLDLHDVGDALLHSGFADPVLDIDRITLTYARVRDLMRDLKQLGAHQVASGRSPALTGKGRLAALERAYEPYRHAGVLPASYEIVHAHAWVTTNPQATGTRQWVEPPGFL